MGAYFPDGQSAHAAGLVAPISYEYFPATQSMQTSSWRNWPAGQSCGVPPGNKFRKGLSGGSLVSRFKSVSIGRCLTAATGAVCGWRGKGEKSTHTHIHIHTGEGGRETDTQRWGSTSIRAVAMCHRHGHCLIRACLASGHMIGPRGISVASSCIKKKRRKGLSAV